MIARGSSCADLSRDEGDRATHQTGEEAIQTWGSLIVARALLVGSASTVAALVAYLDRAGFSGLNDSYTPGAEGCKDGWTDAPHATLSVTHGGRTKSVRYYYGCRDDPCLNGILEAPCHPTEVRTLFVGLAAHVDSVAGTTDWLAQPKAGPRSQEQKTKE